jgi:hypothetical protein
MTATTFNLFCNSDRTATISGFEANAAGEQRSFEPSPFLRKSMPTALLTRRAPGDPYISEG